MTPRSLAPFCAALALALSACVVNNSQSGGSTPPDGSGDGGSAADGSAGDGGGDQGAAGPRRARDSTSIRASATRMKGKPMRASRKPIDEDNEGRFDGGNEPEPGGALAVSGFVPTVGAPGTAVEIFGSGFGTNPSGVTVTVGGKSWPVSKVYGDRVVATVPSGAKAGSVVVKVGRKSATAPGTFEVMEDDGAFGQPAKTEHGLIGEVFELADGTQKLPDFNSLGAPVALIALPQLDIAPRNFEQGFPGVAGGLVEWFGIRFSGLLNVPDEGEYKLCLNSDDGSRLFIEDILVVDNDGQHAAKEVCELVYLEPGGYTLRIEYFQGPRYQIALQFKWAKDGGALVPVPESALFRPENSGALAGG